jgi:hypothetical protein
VKTWEERELSDHRLPRVTCGSHYVDAKSARNWDRFSVGVSVSQGHYMERLSSVLILKSLLCFELPCTLDYENIYGGDF